MRRHVPFLALLLLAGPAAADETPFNTVYTTEVLPVGASEVEQWASWLSGKSHQSYQSVQGRTEYERGLAQDLQASLYLNYGWEHDTPGQASARFNGISSEFIYRIWDVYTHPIGIALYVEPAIGPGRREVETKILLQKNFFDDRLITAVNLVMEDEWNADRSSGPVLWHTNTELKLLTGASYRFAPNWSAGAEFEAKREFDGLVLWEHSSAAADSFFVGPTLHYAKDNYFVTLGAQAQLPWAANLSHSPGETVGGYAHEEERVRVQVRIGYEL